MKVVVIGASPRIVEIANVSVRLRWPDASMLSCSTARKGLDLVEQEWPDIVIAHPDFNDSTLSALIQELRGFSNVPLLVLGKEGDEMEAVSSLELGADDYVRLPCDLTELTTRIWALMRRAGATATYEAENPLTSGHLMVNPATYEAFLSGRRLTLTTTEFRMLFLLIKNWGIVLSRQTLERTLWDEREDSYGLGKEGDEMEAVSSLELGADDYVRLPCDLTELTTRMGNRKCKCSAAVARCFHAVLFHRQKGPGPGRAGMA